MSFDFSKVKSITIPEGDVKQIQDSNGTIIWRGVKEYTITIVGNGFTYTGAGTYEEGTSYTVTLTANSDYCFTSYDSGGSGIVSFTCDNVTKYTAITYTGTLTEDITINASAIPYYTYTLNDGNTHTDGSLTFNANGQTINLNGVINNSYYYTSSLSINIYIRSRKVFADYMLDDRIITGVSGTYSSTSNLGTWIGSGTAYDYVRVNTTISSDTSTTITSFDSAAGRITNNSYCTAIVTNSSSNKSYSISSSYGTVVTLYCEYDNKSDNSISLSNKDTYRYTYSGEGSFSFGTGSSSPTTRTLSRSTRWYDVTLKNNTGVGIYVGYYSSCEEGTYIAPGGTYIWGDYPYGWSDIIPQTWVNGYGYVSAKDFTVTGDMTITMNAHNGWQETTGSLPCTARYYLDYNSTVGFVGDVLQGSQYNLFNRNGGTHCKMSYNGTIYIAPIPSDLPSGYVTDYYSNSMTCVEGSGWMAWYTQHEDPDDPDSYNETIVQLQPSSYTRVNPDYIRYCKWVSSYYWD